MAPVNYSYQSKKKPQNLSFCLFCNSFASFLLQTSNLMHSSLHLSHRFTSCDLYLHCWSVPSRAKCSFCFGPPEINDSNSKYISALIAQSWKRKRKELWKYKHHCFILSSLLLSFNGLFAPYNSTWKSAFIIY